MTKKEVADAARNLESMIAMMDYCTTSTQWLRFIDDIKVLIKFAKKGATKCKK